MDWVLRAACKDADPDLFFPPHGGSYVEARAVCSKCSVQSACLAETLAREPVRAERYGMWGGLTPEERARLVRTKRLVA